MRSLVLLLAFLAACSSSLSPEAQRAIPKDSEAFTPPEIYETWWSETSECSQMRWRDFATISWRRVEGDGWREDGGKERFILALYEPPGTIYIGSTWLREPIIVKHEMLHALGFGRDHPSPPFGTCNV